MERTRRSELKTYNVGIVGFGFIGKVHAYAYLNLPLFYEPVPLRAKITHVCTSRAETAEKGRGLIGAEYGVTDFREITENRDVDIVHICTPNHLHKEALLSAMRHQKHIYCDKPLVADMEEALEIRSAVDDYRGTAQMTHHLRFFPSTIRAKQLVDENFVGDVLEFRCSFLHAGSADPNAPLKWKLSGKAGGGVIADLGSHVFDLVHSLVGDYDRLIASTRIAYPDRPSVDDPSTRVTVDAEDCVMIVARMKDGSLGTLEATKIATGSEDELRLEVHGKNGAFRFNSMDTHHLEIYDRTSADKPCGGNRGWTRVDTGQRYPSPATGFPGPKLPPGWIRAHMACLANFLQSVASRTPGDPGLRQGMYVQHLMECARRSARENVWLGVEPR